MNTVDDCRVPDSECSIKPGSTSGARAVQRLWFVSRHPGVIDWLHEQGLRPCRVVEHLDVGEVEAGDTVIGVLPPALIAKLNARAVRCVQIVMNVGAGDRGRELSAAAMRARSAELVEVSVKCRPLAVEDLQVRSRPRGPLE